MKYGDPLAGGTWFSDPEERFEANTMPVTETGCILWFGANKKGYGQLKVDGKTIPATHFAWRQVFGEVPEDKVLDHKDHCSPACVNVEHLRSATRSENNSNLSGNRANNTSGHRNVTWNRSAGKWQVSITKEGVRHYYGVFVDLKEAVRVENKARKELFGEFAGSGMNA